MTVHTELSQTHLQIMHYVIAHAPTYILGQLKDDDTPEAAERIKVSNQSTDDLIALGLLEEFSSDAQDMLDTLEKARNRKHRIFRATQLGRAFFKETASQSVN